MKKYEYKGKTYYYTVEKDKGAFFQKYTFYDGDELITDIDSVLPLLTQQINDMLDSWIKKQRKEKLNKLNNNEQKN